jgi:hypothetical protein
MLLSLVPIRTFRTIVIDGPRGPVYLSQKEFSRKLFIALRKNNKKGR